ncbi:thiamine phosphate synthase [Xylanibacter brevis]|jgi:thiamine-phosphate pyrophosphorylase|uniref:thiamine phosphate synthase n=1 Tax=Xylanibacter brevis TaxID=83231 RepID=UPI0004806F62|nr:thiamine phosphate synthase [Xylanibacter brevis]
MKLIILTRATFFVEEDKILTSLFEEGMENLHLYKPGSEPVYSERLLTLLSEDYYKKITVHDHFYLKEEYGLHGIHLDAADIEKPEGYKGHTSCTCHSIEELHDAKKRNDYVFLKTIFDSNSNPDDKQTLDMESLRNASKKGLIDRHVYAMGGICLDNIKEMKDLGFGGVVICGDIWNRFSIHHGQDFKELITHFQKLQKAVS